MWKGSLAGWSSILLFCELPCPGSPANTEAPENTVFSDPSFCEALYTKKLKVLSEKVPATGRSCVGQQTWACGHPSTPRLLPCVGWDSAETAKSIYIGNCLSLHKL